MIDFTLPPETEDLRLRVRAFVETHVLPLESAHPLAKVLGLGRQREVDHGPIPNILPHFRTENRLPLFLKML